MDHWLVSIMLTLQIKKMDLIFMESNLYQMDQVLKLVLIHWKYQVEMHWILVVCLIDHLHLQISLLAMAEFWFVIWENLIEGLYVLRFLVLVQIGLRKNLYCLFADRNLTVLGFKGLRTFWQSQTHLRRLRRRVVLSWFQMMRICHLDYHLFSPQYLSNYQTPTNPFLNEPQSYSTNFKSFQSTSQTMASTTTH